MQIIQEPGDPAHIGLVLSIEEFELLAAAVGHIAYTKVLEGWTEYRYTKAPTLIEVEELQTCLYNKLSGTLEERGIWK